MSDAVAEALRPPKRETIWQWACERIDWSREPRYRSAWPGKFNPDLFGWYREPLEDFLDPSVREIIMVKPTQAGGSENLILIPIRWAACNSARTILYASAQQERTEEFFIERIKRGMRLIIGADSLIQSATERGYVYEIGGCTIVCTWARSGSGFKQRPVDWCFGDEVSSWPDVSVVEEMRKRTATRPGGKIILVSTLDVRQTRPTDEDPIWLEWETGDRREWMCEDPAQPGKRFVMTMGTPDTSWGLKWCKDYKRDDGSYDLHKVYKTAHYVTPGGAILRSRDDRLSVIRTGKWIPTASETATPGKRSYRFNEFLLPFACGDFGEMAVRFLEAVSKGTSALRAFVYECLAEPWKEQYAEPDDAAIGKLVADYRRGEIMFEVGEWAERYKAFKPMIFVTVDVQRSVMYYVVRAWITGGHSALVLWDKADSLDIIAERVAPYFARYPGRAYIDNSYSNRQPEVRRWCLERWMRDGTQGNCWVPVYGREHIYADISEPRKDYVYEGVRGDQRAFVWSYTWRPSNFKGRLLDRMNGLVAAEWRLYKGIEHEYIWQVTSEECVDGKWRLRRGHKDNHLWDCEVMQLMAAQNAGLL